MSISLSTFSAARGFTLFEMLMTIALLTFLVGLSALAGSDSYQRALAGSDVERIAGVLRQARSLAQANACRVPPCREPKEQGARITSGEVILFEGPEFSESSALESVPLSGTFVIEPKEILFQPRSGEAVQEERLHLTDRQGQSRTLTISRIGVIAIGPI